MSFKPNQGPRTLNDTSQRAERDTSGSETFTRSLSEFPAATMQVRTQSRETKDAATHSETILQQQVSPAVQAHIELHTISGHSVMLFVFTLVDYYPELCCSPSHAAYKGGKHNRTG